ncbi:MAG TPA: hypothetical protein VE058_03820 [Steroidobacteraceae bacterium]|nr:hypothetical protein [Steroidobacteraceae bacterium]
MADPIAVVLRAAILPPRRVADIRPESGVRIGRHLKIVKLLIRDQGLDLRAVNIEIDLFGGREFFALHAVELLQHVLPHSQARRLTGRIDLRQVILNRLLRIFVIRELLLPPLPLIGVNRLELSIGAGPRGASRVRQRHHANRGG